MIVLIGLFLFIRTVNKCLRIMFKAYPGESSQQTMLSLKSLSTFHSIDSMYFLKRQLVQSTGTFVCSFKTMHTKAELSENKLYKESRAL